MAKVKEEIHSGNVGTEPQVPYSESRVHGLPALASAGSSVTSHPTDYESLPALVRPKKRRSFQTVMKSITPSQRQGILDQFLNTFRSAEAGSSPLPPFIPRNKLTPRGKDSLWILQSHFLSLSNASSKPVWLHCELGSILFL